MTIDAVSEMTNNALYVIIKVSLPVLLVSLVVGLVISIFQTVTSIQEQTLTSGRKYGPCIQYCKTIFKSRI